MPYARAIKPGSSVRLANFDPSETDGLTKEEGVARREALGARLGELEELLYVVGTHSLLIVLQGRDASGKDGAIKRLLGSLHGPTTKVIGFKVPSTLEASHDFLWRVHAQAPARGEVTVFNRSHYEDVLAARVHKLVPRKVWERRYEHINAFEALLADEGTIVVKFYLHISPEEQESRLRDREKEPMKAWKLNVSDWKERERWEEYTAAYEDALRKCSTEAAPWRLVSADKKWFRDLAIAEALVAALEPYEAAWRKTLERLGEERRAELAAYRAGQPE